MKTFLLIHALLFCQLFLSQKSDIPKCLAEKIEKKQKASNVTFPYQALYKVEVKGAPLYELVTDYGKAKFVKMPTVHYVNENCESMHSSDDRDWQTYRQSIKRLETMWVREFRKPSYSMDTFLNSKRKFTVFALHSDFPQFALKEKQIINISLKDGLQIVENGKVKQAYKIIPKEKIQYNPDTRKSKPADGEICNAILLEHDKKYWLLYAEEGPNFLLISTDKTGQFGFESKKASLVLTTEKK